VDDAATQTGSSSGLISPVDVGQVFTFSKTLGEFDLCSFSAISGDFAPQHVDDEYMKTTRFGRRIAHGGLMVALMSSVAAAAAAAARTRTDETALSVGYDRIRFTAPAYIDDTLTVSYTVASVDVERRRSVADVRLVNQNGELVASGQHLMKWV
jgi:acyl dehydratase